MDRAITALDCMYVYMAIIWIIPLQILYVDSVNRKISIIYRFILHVLFIGSPMSTMVNVYTMIDDKQCLQVY